MIRHQRYLGPPLFGVALLLALVEPASAQGRAARGTPPPPLARPTGTAVVNTPPVVDAPPVVLTPPADNPTTMAYAQRKDRVGKVRALAKTLGAGCKVPADEQRATLLQARAKLDPALAAKLGSAGVTTRIDDRAAEGLLGEDGKKLNAQVKAFAGTCADFCGLGATVDVCGLSAPVPANAAVSADWSTLGKVVEHLNDVALAEARLGPGGMAVFGVADKVADIKKQSENQSLAAGGLAALGSAYLPVLFQGLAKLIEDRMKQEAVGWALDRIGTDLCGPGAEPPDATFAEVRGYWFPALCRLSKQDRLYDYGAGATLLKSFRGSLVEDVRAWPGTGAGIGVGLGFWAEASRARGLAQKDQAMFVCGKSSGTADAFGQTCSALKKVRQATGKRVTGLLDGGNAALAFQQLSGDLDEVNRWEDEATKTTKLYSPTTQVAACLAALPQSFADLYPAMKYALDNNQADAARATALAAFATIPACWTVVGRGAPADACEKAGWDRSNAACKSQDALQVSVPMVRVNTVVALEAGLGAKAQAIVTQVGQLEAAIDSYNTAAANSKKAYQDLKIPAPSLQGLKLDQPGAAAEAIDAYISGVLKATGAPVQAAHLNAALAVAESSVALARAGNGLLLAAKPELFPGLQATAWVDPAVEDVPAGPGKPAVKGHPAQWAGAGTKRLEQVDDALAMVSEMLSGARALAAQDWATASTRILDGLHRATVNQHGEVVVVIEAASRHTAAVVAILSARDGDQMAQALNAVASPPGGWRAKGKEHNFTFSITAHPGLWVAGEKRWGPYGAFMEGGRETYLQAPTVALPVGLEFAWGTGCGASPIALFFPILDPVAFLDYDAGKGRLPAPSLKTVLAPGFGLRIGIDKTPFSFMPMVVYRPGFRLWKAEVGGNGADALQVGLMLSVDVTLFDFVSHTPTPAK
jgi:hypothetical protein